MDCYYFNNFLQFHPLKPSRISTPIYLQDMVPYNEISTYDIFMNISYIYVLVVCFVNGKVFLQNCHAGKG